MAKLKVSTFISTTSRVEKFRHVENRLYILTKLTPGKVNVEIDIEIMRYSQSDITHIIINLVNPSMISWYRYKPN